MERATSRVSGGERIRVCYYLFATPAQTSILAWFASESLYNFSQIFASRAQDDRPEMPYTLPLSPSRERAQQTTHTSQRQPLAARKGSVSAPDPFGTRSTAPQPRSVISKLTIVRIAPLKDLAEEPGKRHGHARQGSGSAPGRSNSGSGSAARSASPSRLSFASATFVPSGRPQSPTLGGGSGQHRHTSSASSSRSSHMMDSYQRYSPNQIYDLAKHLPSCASGNPTSFTELASDILLPFIDRPSEIKELLSSGANSKLMALLSRTFPPEPEEHGHHLPPESWTYTDVVDWLTQITRGDLNDAAWVATLRKAVIYRSEVLWERMKSMLGIPPGLAASLEAEPQTPGGSPAPARSLNIDVLRVHPPLPLSPTSSNFHLSPLRGISEVADEESSATPAIEIKLGLRITTPLAFPTAPRPSSPSSPSLRVRTISHGAVPPRSSPLAPPKVHQITSSPSAPSSPRIRPAQVPSAISIVQSKAPSRPPPNRQLLSCLFPASFDKLSIHPRLLSIT